MYFWNLLVATSSACVLTEEGKVEKTKKNSLQFEIGVFFCSEREPERSKKKKGVLNRENCIGFFLTYYRIFLVWLNMNE